LDLILSAGIPEGDHLLVECVLIVPILRQRKLGLLDRQLWLLRSEVENRKKIVSCFVIWVESSCPHGGGDCGSVKGGIKVNHCGGVKGNQ
jgi:hypothetical protein